MGVNRWLLALAVPGFLLTSATCGFSQNWKLTSAPITNWVGVASSADGSRLAAVGRGLWDGNYGYPAGPIYCSTNSGANWTQTPAPIQAWDSVACSADGSIIIASAEESASAGTAVYISTNSGITWIERTPAGGFLNFRSVACSSDGGVVIAGSGYIAGYAYGSELFISTNRGEAWTSTSMMGVLSSLTCSADGTKMAAGFWANLSLLTFVSTNSGAAWRQSFGGGDMAVCSADGNKLAVCPDSGSQWAGPLWLSEDFGNSWIKVTNAGVIGSALALSADGTKLIAAANQNLGGPIFSSTDSGANWLTTDAPITNWMSVAGSADACKLLAVVGHAWPDGGGIYTWQTTPTPELSITPSASGFVISWIVPSQPFALQENTDLNPANWSDVTATPILNLTNLHHEVSVPLSSTNQFFRLKSL